MTWNRVPTTSRTVTLTSDEVVWYPNSVKTWCPGPCHQLRVTFRQLSRFIYATPPPASTTVPSTSPLLPSHYPGGFVLRENTTPGEVVEGSKEVGGTDPEGPGLSVDTRSTLPTRPSSGSVFPGVNQQSCYRTRHDTGPVT